jgi:hypothetical protein
MNELEIFLRIAFLGLGVILLILTIVSFSKVKELKIAFAACGFALFVVEGIFLVGGISSQSIEDIVTMEFLILANFVALVFFYLSIIKR